MRAYKLSVSRRGFYLIGLLIVLAIIAILSYKQMAGETGVNQAVMYTDRSRDVACSTNRTLIAQHAAIWRTSHMGETPTMELLLKSNISIPICPKNGAYSMSPDGQTVYCSVHAPAPTPTPVAGAGNPAAGVGNPAAGAGNSAAGANSPRPAATPVLPPIPGLPGAPK